MPSKLQSCLQQCINEKSRNSKLPLIYQSSSLQQRGIKKLSQRKKLQLNQGNLTYSKNKIDNKQVVLLRYRTKRNMTQDSMLDYKKLDRIQQNIMMQIKDIDICLQGQRCENKQKLKTSLFHGFIFFNQINQFVIQKFYDCLRIQSDASNAIVQGFEVPKYLNNPHGQSQIVAASIVKKITSINNKLLNKSMKTIQQYDGKKNFEYQKNCSKQWSHFKRVNTQASEQLDNKKSSVKANNERRITFVRSIAIRSQSKSSKLFQSKIAQNDSNSRFNNEMSFLGHSKQTKNSKNYSVKTMSSQVQNKSHLIINLTKGDVKIMLNRHRNLVSIWIPPASYPQFYGIFTYKIIKMQKTQASTPTLYKCKINKYFFYKFSLTKKVFDGISDWVVNQTNLPIDFLEITVQKSLYSNVFAKLGWVLKLWQSANKVKAIYQKIPAAKRTQSKK